MTNTGVDLTKFTITQRNQFQIMKKTQSIQIKAGIFYVNGSCSLVSHLRYGYS